MVQLDGEQQSNEGLFPLTPGHVHAAFLQRLA